MKIKQYTTPAKATETLSMEVVGTTYLVLRLQPDKIVTQTAPRDNTNAVFLILICLSLHI